MAYFTMRITGQMSVAQIFLSILLCGCIAARDSIMQGEQLKDGEFLVSAGGVFELGFFHLDASKSHYLGSWFKDQQMLNQYLGTELDPRPLWVANRDTPISDSAGILTIDSNGTLQINYGERRFISLSSNHSSTNLTATMLDSGNFVLTGLSSNGARENHVLWQSFDYPTDVLLPGMKLGANLVNQNWSLTSWSNDQNPSSGAFNLVLDSSGQLVANRRGKIYWTSGQWNGQYFEDLPTTALDIQNDRCSSVSTKDEYYFSCSEKKISSDESILWMMTFHGQLVAYQINGIDSSKNVFTPLEVCNTGNKHFKPSKEKLVVTSSAGVLYDSDSDTSLGLSDCEAYCKRDCSCIAYAAVNSNGTGCIFYPSGTDFKPSSKGTETYRLSSGKRSFVSVWLTVSAVSVLIILLVLISCLRWKKTKKRGIPSRDNICHDNLMQGHDRKGQELPVYRFDIVESATNSFSSVNMLGKGGFGPVYKGILQNGQEIAIKRLSKSSGQGLLEFKNEIELIAKLQHTNLVRMLGYCIQGEEKILIYEYMANRSLELYLFDQTKKAQLDWKRRTYIIEGIAQGLLYLHKYSRLKIIHRDLKASNILLDAEMNPKISDFGMARIFGNNENEANTNRIVGTYGYMSPEYAMNGVFSVKSDVYSYGVLLLEILSGRKNVHFAYSDRHLNLTGHAWETWQRGDIAELLDPIIRHTCPKEDLSRFVHVSLLCVQESAMDRPTMSDVVLMLSRETMQLPEPKQPAFNFLREEGEGDAHLSSGKANACFSSDLIISTIEGR